MPFATFSCCISDIPFERFTPKVAWSFMYNSHSLKHIFSTALIEISNILG